MSASLSAVFSPQFFTDAGLPAAGARLYTYVPSTTTQKTAYTDSAASVAHTYTSDGLGGQYIALNARGELPASLYLTSGGYDLCLKTAAGATIWTRRADAVAEIATSLADATSTAKGDALVAVVHPASGAATRTQHAKNQDLPTSADFTLLADANNAVPNGVLSFTAGLYSVAPITLGRVSWRGLGATSDIGTTPGASVQKAGNGTTIILGASDTFLQDLGIDANKANYTGNGVQIAGSRCQVRNVSVINAQGIAWQVGGVGATGAFNANLPMFWFPSSIGATGRGWYQDHTGGTVSGAFPAGAPDVNVGTVVGGDFRLGSAEGMVLENSIDWVYNGLHVAYNALKGIVLKANSRGHKFFGTYAESNNSGTAGGAGPGTMGDEIDIEAGSVEHGFWGLRSHQSAGAGIRDVNAPGKNLIEHYDNGIGGWVRRAILNVWNPASDGSTTVDLNVYFGANQYNLWSLRAAVSGASGGLTVFYTKQDGGTLTSAWTVDAIGRLSTLKAHVPKMLLPTYSASIAVDASLCNEVEITATNGTAFTISDPTNPSTGQLLSFTVRNTSGGALGALTWGASFKLSAWTQPANGFSRTITYRYNGANWVEYSRTPSDVPN